MIRPTAVTLALAAAATASVLLVRFDPWQRVAAVTLVSTQSAARRVLPELAEDALPRATVTLRTPAPREIHLIPGPDGRHRVHLGDTPLGWADAEAMDGLWSSLRMATTLRAVAAGTDLGPAAGDLAVAVDDLVLTLRIHGPTADGAGLYGLLPDGEPWVVEPELGDLLRQTPEAWVARRLLPLEPAAVAAFRAGDLTVARGEDGLWRVTDGGPRHLLSSAAVDLRLDRALAAGVGPLIPRAEAASHGPYTPRLRVTDVAGHVHEVLSGGPCPERQDHLVVDRGEGMLGCVDADALALWPIADPDAGLVEAQLVPHAYGRVLAVDQQAPATRRLRRFGGGWVIEEAGNLAEVSEPEVFRWYSALQSTGVEQLPADAAVALTPRHRLTLEFDSGQHLRLACGPAGPAAAFACSRDDGPPLRVVGTPPDLAFARDTFADRRLLQIGAADVRALEILPGPGSATVRQSVRLDLGVWRLDAPAHPDGVGVLDEVRLEVLLAALQSARAEAWVEPPSSPPRRSLRVERIPQDRAPGASGLDLYDDCVVRVPDQPRAARIAGGSCTALADDLLYDDPLRFWLRQARSVEITDLRQPTRPITLRRDDPDVWRAESGDPALADVLAGWDAFRSAGIRTGTPPGEPALSARIVRPNAAAVRLELGPVVDGTPAWVRLADAGWHYLARAPDPAEAPDPDPPDPE